MEKQGECGWRSCLLGSVVGQAKCAWWPEVYSLCRCVYHLQELVESKFFQITPGGRGGGRHTHTHKVVVVNKMTSVSHEKCC